MAEKKAVVAKEKPAVKVEAPKAAKKTTKTVAKPVAKAKPQIGADKAEIIGKFKQSQNDTGSAQVQIALLTQRINHLTEHLKLNKHDNHSRRGLLQMVGKRRSFLKYLEKKDIAAYRALIKELNIRG